MNHFSTRLWTFVILCTLGLPAMTITAQDDASMFMQVDYLKVRTGEENEFEVYQSRYWKPIQAQRIMSGEILSWKLYRVQFPSGENSEYNYVIMTTFSDFGTVDIEHDLLSDIVERVHPDMTYSDLVSKGRDLRTLVKSEVFRTEDHLNFQFGANDPPQFLSMDYMKVKPSHEAQYVKLEKEIWKEIHRHRIAEKEMDSWVLYFLQFPGGTTYPYNYATANYFKDWESVVNGWPEEYWEIVHPGADHDALVNMTLETRELVSSQIWRLVDHEEIKAVLYRED